MGTLDLQELVRQVVELLVEGEYEELARLTSETRLSPEEIHEALRQYGRTLVSLPPEAYEKMDVVRVEEASRPTWSVRMPLWTIEEGRSDLSIELTIKDHLSGPVIELDDIHVL